MAKTIFNSLISLIFAVCLLCFTCVSTAPNQETGDKAASSASPAKEEQVAAEPLVRDKLIIPDEKSIEEQNPQPIEMAAAGNNNSSNSSFETSMPINNTNTIPDRNPFLEQENNQVIEIAPQVITRSAPVPEPDLPETESPGDVWITPREITIKAKRSFTTTIHVNTGAKRIAAYGIKIFYDQTFIELDKSKGEKDVVASEQGFLVAKNTKTLGAINISGFDTAGKGPSRDLELVHIYWKAVKKGVMYLNMNIDSLVNENYEAPGKIRVINCIITVE